MLAAQKLARLVKRHGNSSLPERLRHQTGRPVRTADLVSSADGHFC